MNTKRGRPRNIEAEKAILNASYDLLLETGFGAVTVEKLQNGPRSAKPQFISGGRIRLPLSWPASYLPLPQGCLYPIPDRYSVIFSFIPLI